MSAFAAQYALATRVAECERLQAKYPGQAAIVVESSKAAGAKPQFLALPRDADMKALEAAVRAALETSNKKLSLSVAGCAPSTRATVGDLVDACVQEDGFLYVQYTNEKLMGSTLNACGAAYSYGGNEASVYDTLRNEANNTDPTGGKATAG